MIQSLFSWFKTKINKQPKPQQINNPISDPISDPISEQQIVVAIQQLIDKQHTDAKNKIANTGHWGSTGLIVKQAAIRCEQKMMPLPQAEALSNYFNQVLPDIAVLAEQYRHNAADEDGYGLGTVREIEEGLKLLQQKFYQQQEKKANQPESIGKQG